MRMGCEFKHDDLVWESEGGEREGEGEREGGVRVEVVR